MESDPIPGVRNTAHHLVELQRNMELPFSGSSCHSNMGVPNKQGPRYRPKRYCSYKDTTKRAPNSWKQPHHGIISTRPTQARTSSAAQVLVAKPRVPSTLFGNKEISLSFEEGSRFSIAPTYVLWFLLVTSGNRKIFIHIIMPGRKQNYSRQATIKSIGHVSHVEFAVHRNTKAK